ncbi:MAG TPA: tetratricopeptide repeat protein [Puia sp.]|nr:tetratricopeptide repeat protein [Puia sp.]
MFICCTQWASGQQKMADSLVRRLNAHKTMDSTRLSLLNDLAWIYRTSDPAKGLRTADEAIHLGRQLGQLSGMASAFNAKGWNYNSLGEDSLALSAFSQALAIRRQLKDTMGIAKIGYNMGIMYFNLADYRQASIYQQDALALFEDKKDSIRMSSAYNALGLTYQYLADYPQALEYYLKTLAICENKNDSAGMAPTFSNLGILYKNMSKFDRALEYQRKALALYEKLGDKQGMANCLGNIGVVYDNQEDPVQSMTYYEKALDICRSIGYQWGIASNLSNIGSACISQHDYSRALENLQQALPIWQRIGDRNNEGETRGEIARIYMDAPATILASHGIIPQNRYALAKAMLQKSLSLAHDIRSPARQQMAWQYLAELHEKEKDFAGALTAYKQAALFRDSILNTEKEKEITRKELQYEFQRKQAVTQAFNDKRQALAAAEIGRQRIIRNAIIGGACLIILAGTITFTFYRKNREAQYRRHEAEMEMTALRAQMNPHFIFNSLNSINDFISKHDLENADLYLTRFASLMRMVLENSGHKEVSLSDDLRALETYMQLECMRLKQAFTYHILVDDSIDREMTMVPPLLLQPFVENSIWHGIAGKEGKGKIIVSIQKEQGMIYCTVEDNGTGRHGGDSIFPNTKKRSLGMKITASRIAMLNKFEHGPAGLEITDLQEGMKVAIRLPFELRY